MRQLLLNKGKILSTKPFLVAAVIALVCSVLIVQLPLLNYLGFEFSIAIALLIPWVAGAMTIKRIRSRVPDSSARIDPPVFRNAVGESLVQSLGILLIPFTVVTLNALIVRNCSYRDGVFFFILIPVITAVWSVAFASFCAVVVRRAGVLYTVATLAILIYPLYLGYSSPQIYSYSPIYGFFPGFSYDEMLSITPALLLCRGLTLIAAIFFMLLSRLLIEQEKSKGTGLIRRIISLVHIYRPDKRTITLIASLLLLLAAWIFRHQLGFETSAQYIQSELGARYTTEHFHIYYAPASFTAEEMQWVGLQHEFRYDQVERALQVHPTGRIASYIYPDADAKHRLIGTLSTNIAKPWRMEIHLNKDSWQQTLKHELVHVMAGEFGMPIIRAHYNIGLVEGLATALDGDIGNRTLHEYAAAVHVFELVAHPEQLIRPVGFALKASTVSYTLMGSFCKHLIDRYGMMRFKEVYGGRSVEDVYGRTYDELIVEWQDFLKRITVPVSWRSHIEFYFNRPSIFAKECARTVANLNGAAYRKLDANNAVAAMTIFSQALMTSWNSESYQGLVRAAYAAARYDTVVCLVASQIQDSLGSSSILNLFLLYGDALWYRGDALLAKQTYNEILDLDLSDRLNESAAMRLEAIDDKRLRTSLPDYFVGTFNDSTAETYLDSLQRQSPHPLLSYLNAKLHLRKRNDSDAIHEIDTLQTLFSFPILNAGREQILGQALFRQKEFQQARAHFWQSLNYIPNQASRERVEDWLEQCEWFEKNFKTE
ncbi:MAG: hypothetical protein HYR77_11065 [Ignavibacteria bacterium]|nr:hypothetical protein [Ignavibacteria bacterium]